MSTGQVDASAANTLVLATADKKEKDKLSTEEAPMDGKSPLGTTDKNVRMAATLTALLLAMVALKIPRLMVRVAGTENTAVKVPMRAVRTVGEELIAAVVDMVLLATVQNLVVLSTVQVNTLTVVVGTMTTITLPLGKLAMVKEAMVDKKATVVVMVGATRPSALSDSTWARTLITKTSTGSTRRNIIAESRKIQSRARNVTIKEQRFCILVAISIPMECTFSQISYPTAMTGNLEASWRYIAAM